MITPTHVGQTVWIVYSGCAVQGQLQNRRDDGRWWVECVNMQIWVVRYVEHMWPTEHDCVEAMRMGCL